MPVRIGRVSSREAERATLPIVSTKRRAPASSRPGRRPARAAAGSPRRAACACGSCAVPATISTSRSVGRSSSETSPPGSLRDDVEQQARRAARPCPGASTVASSGTRRPTSMSVARSSTPSVRRRRSGRRRAPAPRCASTPRATTVCSWASSSCGRGRELHDEDLMDRSGVIGAVDMWTARGEAAAAAGMRCTSAVRTGVWSLSVSAGRHRSRRRRSVKAPNGLVGLGVGGDALGGARGRRAGRSCGCARRSARRSPAGLSPVCSRARYMATCRGQATPRGAAGGEQLVAARCRRPRRRAPGCASTVEAARCAACRGGRGYEVVEDLARRARRERRPRERGEGDDADERALEGADVGRRTRSAISSSTRVVGDADAVVLHALAQHGEARGESGGWMSVTQPGLEALAQAVLERAEVARQAVGGQHELAAGRRAAR